MFRNAKEMVQHLTAQMKSFKALEETPVGKFLDIVREKLKYEIKNETLATCLGRMKVQISSEEALQVLIDEGFIDEWVRVFCMLRDYSINNFDGSHNFLIEQMGGFNIEV